MVQQQEQQEQQQQKQNTGDIIFILYTNKNVFFGVCFVRKRDDVN